ncbi:hypothetical protein [Sandarakinorhabdus sp.]|jgi:hypothetical protein|uniref:hypothetical protein n=1 Tax=Sandarakinorhabdus sp. TaxID=1916663 RepID=UPI0035662B42
MPKHIQYPYARDTAAQVMAVAVVVTATVVAGIWLADQLNGEAREPLVAASAPANGAGLQAATTPDQRPR